MWGVTLRWLLDFQTLGAQTGGSYPPNPKCSWLCQASLELGTPGHGTSLSMLLASTLGATTLTELCTTKVSEGCREGQKAAPRPRLSTRSTGAVLLPLECASESPGRLVKQISWPGTRSVVRLIWGGSLGIAISNKLPGYAHAAGPRTTLGVKIHICSGFKGKV